MTTNSRCQSAALVAAVAVMGVSAQSQTPSAPLRFEVVSIKANRSGDPFPSVGSGPGRYQIGNAPLLGLIQSAFQVQPSQIVDAPAWAAVERFDIMATMPEGVPQGAGTRTHMLRALLEERFKLVSHRETRELPVFALVLARSDGTVSPGLEPGPVECADAVRPIQPGRRPPCNTNFGTGSVTSGGITMAGFASLLTSPLQVGRIVQDRTGLAGYFQFDLTYTPDQLRNGTARPGLPAVDPNGPSLVTALQEQLGLRLEPTRGPVDVVVIDSVERPTGN
jgi:uncharacterized protein (TIGR03435 family)